VPTFTFFATAGCVSRVGATPVFVDSCPVCFNIDLADAQSKITLKTKAIIPVHLFGQSADLDDIVALSQEFDLKIIEDAAQAIGARYRGKSCGTVGEFGTYSFFPSKNLGGFGDSGALVTQDDALAEKARILRNHGMQPKYFHHLIGGNFRIDALQAAILRVKIPHYPQYTSGRQRNANRYIERLTQVPGIAQANPGHCHCNTTQQAWASDQNVKIILPVAYAHNEHIWNQFTLRVLGPGQRDALKQHLMDRKIGCEIYYPMTLDQQPCFQHLPESSRQGCATAHLLANEVLSIPIYAELQESQLDEVIETISDFVTTSP
jgi:dTDP-4-amino-4,6-dideoxygalactose transaminase